MTTKLGHQSIFGIRYPTRGPANISQENILHIAAGRKTNQFSPVVSLLQTERVSPARSAADSPTGWVNLQGRSLYTHHPLKTGIFETTTLYNQKLGGLSLRVGRLFPGSEVSV